MNKNKRFYSMVSAFIQIIITLFVTGLVGSASICLAQDSPWTTKTDIPSSRWFLSSSAVNGKIYAIGGVGTNRTKVEEYNPATDRWVTKTPMLPGRAMMAAATVNGKIYAIGGTDHCCPTGTVFATTAEYDPATDTWTTKKNMPTPRTGICAGVVDEKIYVIGGNPPVKKVEMYDPATDTWTPKQDMPTARWGPTCGVVNGKIYVFGGILNANGGAGTKVVEMYDPATDTWSRKTDMPESRLGHATAVVNGQVYIFGGTISGGGLPAYSNLWVYDPPTDTWDTSFSNMPFKWFTMGYSVVNERVYLMAGSAVPWPHGDGLRRVAEYNPRNDLSRLVENVNIDRSYAKAGIDSVWITTKMSNPAGITLFAEIETPDQTSVASLQLFDDGNHGDGSAGDSLFSNFWPVLSSEERQYFIDLQVSRVDTDTVNHRLNNMASFTTKGPVTIDHVEIDGVVNPGDIVNVKFYFKNNGKTATIADIEGRMTILDSCITDDRPGIKPTLDSLPAGEVKLARNLFRLKIAKNCPTGPIPVQIDIYEGGNFYWSDTFYVDVASPLSVNDKNAVNPNRFALHQNYPNPFNPETRISYKISQQTRVVLQIMNLLGQEIRTLVDAEKPAGFYEVTWDGKDATGQKMASGVYVYRLETQGFVRSRKMVLLQ